MRSLTGQPESGLLNREVQACSTDWEGQTIRAAQAMSTSHLAEKYYFLTLACTIVLLISPLVHLQYVPLVDFPNHLARCFILYHYHDVASFQQTYRILYEPIPNIACDVFITLLMHFFSALLAGKIFIGLVIVLYALGCHTLAKAVYGRNSWLAIVCAFSVYNSMFMWGFVNYVLGLALFMMALAVWLRSRSSWRAARYVCVASLVLAAFLTHLSAYVFIGVAFVITSAWDVVTRKRTVIEATKELTVLIPPLLAFLLFMGKSGSVGRIVWNTGAGKIIGLFTVVRTYNTGFDAAFAAVIFLTILVLLFTARRLQPRWPLTITAAVFILFYLACPLILFTSSGADDRFIPPALLLLLLSIRVEMPRRTALTSLSLIFALCLLRLLLIWGDWRKFDKKISESVTVTNKIPLGARVYPAWFRHECSQQNLRPLITRWPSRIPGSRQIADIVRAIRAGECTKDDNVFQHVVHYATIHSLAFVPSLHAHRGQQPLVFREVPNYRPAGSSDQEWLNIASTYDFVWSYAMPPAIADKLSSEATVLAQSGNFALWKVHSETTDAVKSGQFIITDPPPPTWYPYNASTSMLNKPLPSDVRQHCFGNSANCRAGDRLAQYLLSAAGQDTDIGRNPGHQGFIQWGMAANINAAPPIYYGQAADPWYHLHNCLYDQVIDVRFHAPNKAVFSGNPRAPADAGLVVYDVAQNILVEVFQSGYYFTLADASSCPGTGPANCAVEMREGAVNPGNSCEANRVGLDSDLGRKNYDGKVPKDRVYDHTPGSGQKTHYLWTAPNGSTHVMGGVLGSGTSAATFIIRENEMMNGTINHALGLQTACTTGKMVFPDTSELQTGDICRKHGWDPDKTAAAGALLFLDYSPKQLSDMLVSHSISLAQHAILKAMSIYGGYIVITGGYWEFGLGIAETEEGGGAYAYYFPTRGAAQRDPIVQWGCANGMADNDPYHDCVRGVANNSFSPSMFAFAGIPRQIGPGSTDRYGNSCSVAPGCYISGHIHMADECIAKRLAGVPGAC